MPLTDITILLAYLSLGVTVGIIAGLLGVGGGMITVPALLLLFSWQGIATDIVMHLAIASSLATMIFTSISSTYAHHTRQAVLWPQVASLAPGIIIGAALGGVIADQLSGDILRRIFGVFGLLVALQLGSGFRPFAKHSLPSKPGMLLIGSGVGTISTVLGIGGGTMTTPFMLWCGINIHKAVATSAACSFPIAVTGTTTMILTGYKWETLPVGSIGYVYWPAVLCISLSSIACAPLGAKLAHSISTKGLQKIFALVLVCIGLRMLF